MRLKFKRVKQVEKKMIFNTTKLKDTNTRFRYWLKVRYKFSYLEETDDIEVRWSNFKDAVHTAVDSVIGRRWSILQEQWISNKSWILKNKKKPNSNETRQFLITWQQHLEEGTMILIKLWRIAVNVTKNGGLKPITNKQNMIVQKTMLGLFENC